VRCSEKPERNLECRNSERRVRAPIHLPFNLER
jgi:hypothetical protein